MYGGRKCPRYRRAKIRQDQFEKVTSLAEKLTDVFIQEAEPTNWPGSTIPVDQHSSTIRGDRVWFKKNAVATLSLIMRMEELIGRKRAASAAANPGAGAVTEKDEETLDEEIKRSEKTANSLIDRVMAGKHGDKLKNNAT